jgi:hypothetical protein
LSRGATVFGFSVDANCGALNAIDDSPFTLSSAADYFAIDPSAVREFYEQAYRDCRLLYNHLPSPRQIQTLVQVWKQLWKWR